MNRSHAPHLLIPPIYEMPGPDDDTSCGGGVRCPTSCSSSGRGSTTPSSALVLPEKLLESRRVEHSCGVYGVFSQSEGASRLAFFALYALNHRGQESAGIASFSTSGIQVHKGMGLVSQVFDEGTISTLSGKHAIGHTRYSTSGGSQLAGAQPFVLETDLGQLAIAHNGQVRGGGGARGWQRYAPLFFVSLPLLAHVHTLFTSPNPPLSPFHPFS